MPDNTSNASSMSLRIRSSAAYGHACMACAQAKCRCLPRASGGKCQRCARLKKDCVQSPRKRVPKQLSKTAQLEQKVDELLSLLHTSRPTTETGTQRSPGLRSPSPVNPVTISDSNPTPTEVSQGSCEIVTPGYEDELLKSFRTKKLPFFPFVHVSDTQSAQSFKEKSPYLWRCIEITESGTVDAAGDMITRLRYDLSNALLVHLEKSLDLLHAVLVYLAWIKHQSQTLKSSLCMFCQLANGLIIELGLTTPPSSDLESGTFNQFSMGQLPNLRPRVSETRTMNERRAVISFFVLSSMISYYLGRMEPLRWTPHMSDCLDILSSSSETPNDAVLVQLTRARLLAVKISDGPWNDPMFFESTFPRAPSSSYILAVQSQLERTRAQIPTELQNNKTILFHLYDTEVSIYELGLKQAANGDDFKILDFLYASLYTVKSFFDLTLSSPCLDFASFPLTHGIQMAHCFVTLFRLSTLDFPGWDKPTVRRMADIVSIAHEVSEKWRQVASVVGSENRQFHHDAFAGIGAMVQKLKAGWAARLGDSGNDSFERDSMNEGKGQGDMDALFRSPESAWLLDAFFSGGIF